MPSGYSLFNLRYKRTVSSCPNSALASINSAVSKAFGEPVVNWSEQVAGFGCEANDKMNFLAFNRKTLPLGSQMNALFGSDISHFDVADLAGLLPEAYELVEGGLMDADNFRDFVVTNPVHFLADANPDFFKGTAVE